MLRLPLWTLPSISVFVTCVPVPGILLTEPENYVTQLHSLFGTWALALAMSLAPAVWLVALYSTASLPHGLQDNFRVGRTHNCSRTSIHSRPFPGFCSQMALWLLSLPVLFAGSSGRRYSFLEISWLSILGTGQPDGAEVLKFLWDFFSCGRVLKL